MDTIFKSEVFRDSAEGKDSNKNAEVDKTHKKRLSISDTKKTRLKKESLLKTSTSKPRNVSSTSIGSATDLIRKINSARVSSRKMEKERKVNKLSKHLKREKEKASEHHHEHQPKPSKSVHAFKKSPGASTVDLTKLNKKISSKELKKRRSKPIVKKTSSKLLYKSTKNDKKRRGEDKRLIIRTSSFSIKEKHSKSKKPVVDSVVIDGKTSAEPEVKVRRKDISETIASKQPSQASIARPHRLKNVLTYPCQEPVSVNKGLNELKDDYHPLRFSLPRKHCKGECIGRGRIVYSEKDSNVVPHINDSFIIPNKRKHMSIFNLDRYMQSEEHEQTSTESIKLKNSKTRALGGYEPTETKLVAENKTIELKCNPVSTDKLARQKISAHRTNNNKECWEKIEVENDTFRLLRSKKSKPLKFKETGKTSLSGFKSNGTDYETSKTNDWNLHEVGKSGSGHINKIISELAVKINLVNELRPDELMSKQIQEEDIDSIESSVVLLKEILKRKKTSKRQQLLEMISKMNLQSTASDKINLQTLPNLNNNRISRGTNKTEIHCFSDDTQLVDNCNHNYIEKKCNEVQTEVKKFQNAAIQHKTRNFKENTYDAHIYPTFENIPVAYMETVMENSCAVDEIRHSLKSNRKIHKSDSSLEHMKYHTVDQALDENLHKKEKKKVRKKKSLREKRNGKDLPFWSNAYQLQSSFHCESVEKLEEKIIRKIRTNTQNSSNLMRFDTCHSTSSSNFIIHHITKSQRKEDRHKPEIPAKLTNTSSFNSIIHNSKGMHDSDMSEDSLIYNFSQESERRDCNQGKHELDSKTYSDLNSVHIEKKDDVILYYESEKHANRSQLSDETQYHTTLKTDEIQTNCSVATFGVPETFTNSEIEARSKKSYGTIQLIKEKTEEEEKIQTEKISDGEEGYESEPEPERMEKCEETGKYEDEIQFSTESLAGTEGALNKVTEDTNLEIKDKCSLSHTSGKKSIKFSLVVHKVQNNSSISNQKSENTKHEQNVEKDYEISLVSSKGQPNMPVHTEDALEKVDEPHVETKKTKLNGMYRFPSITIYNRKYVNTIGDWMKNCVNENLSDEKVTLRSLLSIENDSSTMESYSTVLSKTLDVLNDAIKNPEIIREIGGDSMKLNHENQFPVTKTNWQHVYKQKEKTIHNENCNKTLESQIPASVQTPVNRNAPVILNEMGADSNYCPVLPEELFVSQFQSAQSSQSDIMCCQSNTETLTSLNSLGNDSTTTATKTKNLKENKPKYHLISRTYCTVDDCINVGEEKLRPIQKISNTSLDNCFSKPAQLNSNEMLSSKSNKSFDATTSCTIQTNTSCMDRLQSLVSSLHNKKQEKPKKGLWKNFITSLKKKENFNVEWRGSKKLNSRTNKVNVECPKNDNFTMYCNRRNMDIPRECHRSHDVELLQGNKELNTNTSLRASSYQIIFSKDTDITELTSGIEVLYLVGEMDDPRDSETFTICTPNSRFGLNSRSRSMESFFKPEKEICSSKSECFDYKFTTHPCSPLKKSNSSSLLVRNRKLQECYHYCQCGQLLKIEI